MSDKLALDRATYKKIKGFDRNQMEQFLTALYQATRKMWRILSKMKQVELQI